MFDIIFWELFLSFSTCKIFQNMVKYSCKEKRYHMEDISYMEYKTKILIADESPASRAAMREGLLRSGYHNVEEAVNGEEAVLKM